MNSETSGAAAIDKALSLLALVARDQGRTPLAELAAHASLAPSTARRMIAALMRRGLVARAGRGRFAAGFTLSRLAALADTRRLLAHATRGPLRALAVETGATAHLGVLENDMVTYLVKERAPGAADLFTREGGQLEAYCSGVGKVLLAALTPADLDGYLSGGPFVALTERTRTAPADLRAVLQDVRARGHAIDEGEIAAGLYCIAAPLIARDGATVAAISLSGDAGLLSRRAELIARLQACARTVAAALEPAA
jgi:IclR family transcriptional regulator, acetate operon repressor